MGENAIETSKTFQDRMMERIRAQIGELMSDQDLKVIVNHAVHLAFFERVQSRDRYGELINVDKEPVVVTEIRKLLEPEVCAQVRLWMDEHSAEVKGIVGSTLRDGISRIVLQSIDERYAYPLQTLRDAMHANGLMDQ